jgi:hypothetical protein
MSAEEILNGIRRLPLPLQKRLLRRVEWATRHEHSHCIAVPLWQIRRDPIFYVWLQRIYQLPNEECLWLAVRLRELIKQSEKEATARALQTGSKQGPSSRWSEIHLSYEDFVEARREAWYLSHRESE